MKDEYLALSGIQHFVYCPRQWALIHLEQQWDENLLTTQGNLMHARAHDEELRERRGKLLIVRGLSVHSHGLKLQGKCDVVEFKLNKNGVPLAGESGFWVPTPVEYKHGKPKFHDADRLQLCAQALCLEEMLCCDISEGMLYYGKTHARERVCLDDSLREKTRETAQEMHRMFEQKHTPKVRPSSRCSSCSLKDICSSSVFKRESVSAYVLRHLKGDSCES